MDAKLDEAEATAGSNSNSTYTGFGDVPGEGKASDTGFGSAGRASAGSEPSSRADESADHAASLDYGAAAAAGSGSGGDNGAPSSRGSAASQWKRRVAPMAPSASPVGPATSAGTAAGMAATATATSMTGGRAEGEESKRAGGGKPPLVSGAGAGTGAASSSSSTGTSDVDVAASDDTLSERVILNVGGTRFETFATTLAAYPETLLGAMFHPKNRAMRRPDSHGEYFFDRDPVAFQVILNFYRCHRIIVPAAVPPELVGEECTYFQLPVGGEEDESELFTFGRGEFGQLGVGDRRSSWEPRLVETLRGLKVTQVSLGTSHSAALAADGRIFTWGYGGDGRLGLGNHDDQLVPTLVEALVGEVVTQVVCGELHTAAVTSAGQLFTWGLGKDHRLGHSDTRTQLTPCRVRMPDNLGVKQVACGGLHTLALTDEGLVASFGLAKDGRLGHGNELETPEPKVIESLLDRRIVQVLCGGHHSAVLDSQGVMLTFGFDDDGRLGHNTAGHRYLPEEVTALLGHKVKQIACGCWHSAALTEAGALFTWGSCKSGQLGQGHKNSCATPRVVLQGKGGGIVSVACGTAHTAALTASGDLYCWGKSEDGRLGFAASEDQTSPTLVSWLSDRGKAVRQVVCGVYDTAVLTE